MKRTGTINYWQLSELGSSFALSFSSHEVLNNKIMGLDGIKRKLLVVEKHNGQNWPSAIDLDNINAVSVKNIYKNIQAGELKKKGIEEFLESVTLRFEFRDGRDTLDLIFYEHGVNEINDLSELERKARNWQLMLSKMIIPENKKIDKQKDFFR